MRGHNGNVVASSGRLDRGHRFGGRQLGRHVGAAIVPLPDDCLQDADGQSGRGGSADGRLPSAHRQHGPAHHRRLLQFRHWLAERHRLPNRRIPDRIQQRTIHFHAGRYHQRAVVHHHLRHSFEPTSAAVDGRQNYDGCLDLRPLVGHTAAGRHFQFRHNQVRRLNNFLHFFSFFFFLKKRTRCIEYSKNKTNLHITSVWCYEWMI